MGNTLCLNQKGKNKDYEDAKRQPAQNTQQSRQVSTKSERRCTISDEEVIVAKIRIQMDKMESRIEMLTKREQEIDAVIKTQIDQKRKEDAYYSLVKKKRIRECIKDNKKKINFLDNQLLNIENSINDLGFANAVKESNRTIEKLNSEIDMEEIRLAKQLQDEGKMRRDELMELLDEGEEDQEIQDQLQEIEKTLVSQAGSRLSTGEAKEKKQTGVRNELKLEEDKQPVMEMTL